MARLGLISALLLSATMAEAAEPTFGYMRTTWISRAPQLNTSCKFTDASLGGLASPAATSPYFNEKTICTVDVNLFQGWHACGKCFEVDAGNKLTVVQVVGTFNPVTVNDQVAMVCQQEPFQHFQTTEAGNIPMKYREVRCDQTAGGGVATVLKSGNGQISNIIFSNFHRPVVSAQAVFLRTGQRFQLRPATDGTYVGNLAWDVGPIDFELVLADGFQTRFGACFQEWPLNKVGSTCIQADAAIAGYNQKSAVLPDESSPPAPTWVSAVGAAFMGVALASLVVAAVAAWRRRQSVSVALVEQEE